MRAVRLILLAALDQHVLDRGERAVAAAGAEKDAQLERFQRTRRRASGRASPRLGFL
jgi:hypothetical protein